MLVSKTFSSCVIKGKKQKFSVYAPEKNWDNFSNIEMYSNTKYLIWCFSTTFLLFTEKFINWKSAQTELCSIEELLTA